MHREKAQRIPQTFSKQLVMRYVEHCVVNVMVLLEQHWQSDGLFCAEKFE